MSAVTVLWEDKGYNQVVDLNVVKSWSFRPEKAGGKDFINKVLHLEFFPSLQTQNGPISEMLFSRFILSSGKISVTLCSKTWIFKIGTATEIRLRELTIADSVPGFQNGPAGVNNQQSIINIFLGNDSDQFSYADTIHYSVGEENINTVIRRNLTENELVADDYVISLIGSGSSYVPISKVESLLGSKTFIMNFSLKLIDPIIYYVGNEPRKVRYLPHRPKLLLSWALENLNSDDGSPHEALKRRLIRNANNRAVPIDMLGSIEGLNVTADQFPRAGLPLNSWKSYCKRVKEDVSIQHMLKRCVDDLLPPVSEATLRLRFWDNFSYILIDRKDCVMSELNIQSLIRSKAPVKVDIAAVLPEISQNSEARPKRTLKTRLPILIMELCKDCTERGFSHKDQEKIISSLSLIGLELAREIETRGENPLDARVFGILIGSTEFQFCVGIPEYIFNDELGINELHFNVSVNPHWNFDLLRDLEHDLNCNDYCCSNDELEVVEKPASIPFSLNQVELTRTDVHVNEEHEGNIGEEATGNQIEGRHRFYNVKSVCVLMAFLDCVKNYIDKFSYMLQNEPVKETEIPRIAPINSKSPSSSTSYSPKKIQIKKDKRSTGSTLSASVSITDLEDKVDDDNDEQKSPVKRIKKRPSREFEVYQAIPSPYKHFFPILYDFKTGKGDDGKEFHILELERLQTFILDAGGYSPFIRQDTFDEFILDAGTFAVHVLFDLLLLHEKVGYIHRDVSPNNIMFSPRFKIWKLIDFEQSVPVEESNLKRKGGTVGFVAPESVESHIFTPASDVYALGAVLQKYFCPYLLQDVRSKRDRRLFEAFEALVKEMVQPNPKFRISVRSALKCFMFFVNENAIKGFEVYGMDLLFPLAKIEANSRPAKTSKAPSISSTALPAKRQMEQEGSEKESLQSQPPQIQ